MAPDLNSQEKIKTHTSTVITSSHTLTQSDTHTPTHRPTARQRGTGRPSLTHHKLLHRDTHRETHKHTHRQSHIQILKHTFTHTQTESFTPKHLLRFIWLIRAPENISDFIQVSILLFYLQTATCCKKTLKWYDMLPVTFRESYWDISG